jgi:phospho-N-acetylmuramoyl-pentapeptide-transferase
VSAVASGGQLARLLIGGTASLLICIFLSPKFIEFLRRRAFGQQVRDDGPQAHLVKSGTPTMGGIIMITALAAPFLILTGFSWNAIGVFMATVACALLGFIDDYMKIVRQRSLGLRARTKLIALALISVGLWWIATHKVGLSSDLKLHVTRYDAIQLGDFYPLLIYLVVAGTTSGVNLTDGLDGLASGCAAIVLLAYVLITSITGHDQDLALFASCLLGVCVGFLWFNAFPATIFMGDTGSLGLGGAIAGLAVMTQTEILLLLIGGIFVLEALSVLIQVISFQAFRKRVFMMAPIHHHFELKGWSETKIILRFWIIAAVGAAIGFVIYQHSIKAPIHHHAELNAWPGKNVERFQIIAAVGVALGVAIHQQSIW